MTASAAPPAEPPPDSEPRPARRPPERIGVLAPGVYAWLLTVAHPALQPGVPLAARVFAVAAVVALFGGTLLERRRPVLGRRVALFGFSGGSLVAWVLLGPAIAVANLDPLRSALGVLGWVLYAFGWGSSRGTRVPEDAPNVVAGAPLAPRARISRGGVPILAGSVVAALAFEALAFRVDRQEQALFAHAAATACALLVLGAGSRLALGVGTRRELSAPAARLNATAPPLAALAALFGLGLVWLAFTR